MNAKTSKFIVFTSIFAFVLAIFFSQCKQGNAGKPDVRGQVYADPQSCIKCHKSEYQSYGQTGHYHASSEIKGNSLQTDIIADSNKFVFNDSVKINVVKRKSGIYQTAYFKNQKVRDERFDIAFGSGEKAQTYAYWRGKQLFQLPLSYFKIVHNWGNSPGFPPNLVYYNREIVARCFECHASFADKQFKQNGGFSISQEFDKQSIVYGIDCQRCHGPAAEHVNYHLNNPDDKQAKFIRPYKSLTRQQKLDMCSICHSGNDQKTVKTTFAFQPGDTASHFYEPDFGAASTPDVHGDQYRFLKMSKCFASSATMTCTTCHSSHTKESSSLAVFAQKCLDCHKTENHNLCKLAPQLGNAINSKCVDCHMPALPSKVISFKMTMAKESSPYLLHTHRIAIYPEKTKEILAMIKTTQN